MKKMTKRLYNEYPYAKSVNAIVIEATEQGIVTDQTVAYPESGGQQGDTGNIFLDKNNSIPFSDTQKGYGRTLLLQDFPSINVEVPVYHKIPQEYLDKFKTGQKVRIEIDTIRRERLRLNHSAIHLVVVGLEELFPEIYPTIKGCLITPEKARLDFARIDKFTSKDIEHVQEVVDEMIEKNQEASTLQHELEKEAWYWLSNFKGRNIKYPCGGSHTNNLIEIGPTKVSKKSLGRTTQRISIMRNKANINTAQYFDINT